MARRTRILTFGLAGFVVLVGVLCAVFVNGKTGTVASATLITLGCGFAVLLVFFEVGLSEDHAREREEQERRASTRRDPEIRKLPWSQRRP